MGWEIWICPNFPRDLLSFEADLLFPESRFGQARSMRMGNLHLQSETPGEYGDQAFSEFNFKAARCAEGRQGAQLIVFGDPNSKRAVKYLKMISVSY